MRIVPGMGAKLSEAARQAASVRTVAGSGAGAGLHHPTPTAGGIAGADCRVIPFTQIPAVGAEPFVFPDARKQFCAVGNQQGADAAPKPLDDSAGFEQAAEYCALSGAAAVRGAGQGQPQSLRADAAPAAKCRKREIAGAAHEVNLQAPQQLAKELSAFWESLPKSSDL